MEAKNDKCICAVGRKMKHEKTKSSEDATLKIGKSKCTAS